ncbi:hypothetical protein BN2537_6239 [Streptomyces venezuelae]|nr:hypothetical protein BN2537_6239 [Streptomyces venezuelae]
MGDENPGGACRHATRLLGAARFESWRELCRFSRSFAWFRLARAVPPRSGKDSVRLPAGPVTRPGYAAVCRPPSSAPAPDPAIPPTPPAAAHGTP